MPKIRVCLGFQVALLLLLASRAHGQAFDAVGVRAQGMSAFVAVADDATAAWWNPAGLATGKLFSLAIEHGSIDDPAEPGAVGPGRRDAVQAGFSAAFPALALSYYRLHVTEASPDPGASAPGTSRLRSLAISQYGMTVGQSLGNHLVIGTTITLLRAGDALTTMSGAVDGDALLDAGDEPEISQETKTDLDLGVMAAFGAARLGLTVKHLRAPEFGDEGDRFTLKRQARAGVALVKSTTGQIASVALAADMDLTRTETVNGDVRRFATGVELWLAGKRIGVRSGLSVNTVGDRNPTGSAGVTLGGPSGLYFDAAVLFGRDSSRKGLSVGASMTF